MIIFGFLQKSLWLYYIERIGGDRVDAGRPGSSPTRRDGSVDYGGVSGDRKNGQTLGVFRGKLDYM